MIDISEQGSTLVSYPDPDSQQQRVEKELYQRTLRRTVLPKGSYISTTLRRTLLPKGSYISGTLKRTVLLKGNSKSKEDNSAPIFASKRQYWKVPDAILISNRMRYQARPHVKRAAKRTRYRRGLRTTNKTTTKRHVIA